MGYNPLMMTAVAILHRDEIIDRVAQGEYLASIAASYGLKGKGQAICDHLAQDPEYQRARERGLERKLADREKGLENCEPEYVPRARELLSHARWRAEREAPARWAPRSQVAITGGESIGLDAAVLGAASELLSKRRGRAIENGVTQQDQKGE